MLSPAHVCGAVYAFAPGLKMTARYEVQQCEKLGRYLVAARDLRAGEKILVDEPFVLGPRSDTSLVCFNCYLPLIGKFVVCKKCAVAPICPGDGCPDDLHISWHNDTECEFFRTLKLSIGLHPMSLVQNVGSLLALRAILKKQSNPQSWNEFVQLETRLDKLKNTAIWSFYDDTVKFIQSLGLIEQETDEDVVRNTCAVIDANSFDLRGPLIPAIGCSEILRGVYLKAALMVHDCVGNTHVSINDNHLLTCHASVDIKKGHPIYHNYTDPLKGTAIRQQHLMVGKNIKCACARCEDLTEMDTFTSSALCPDCKTGYVSRTAGEVWTCHDCKREYQHSNIGFKIECCSYKLDAINKKDERELEEYIRNVSLVLAPNHYLLLDAKQRLAGVLRDTINREPRPMKKLISRKMELCNELLPVLEKLCPGMSRTKAITLYELQDATVHLAKKRFDGREITGPVYLDELLAAEKILKRSLEMLFIEPGNSPEGELCAKALEEYRALKATINSVLDNLHAPGKVHITEVENEDAQ